MENVFDRVAALFSGSPWLVLIVSLVVVAILCAGVWFWVKRLLDQDAPFDRPMSRDKPEQPVQDDAWHMPEHTGAPMPQPAPDRDGIRSLVGTTGEPQYGVRRVFFGTDREPTDLTQGKVRFGYGRAEHLRLGLAHITVPLDRTWGKIPRPKTIPLIGVTIEREKASKHFTVSACSVMDEATFLRVAGDEAQASTRFEKAAFIFIHGFNVQFEAALFRTAQMAVDINFDGPAFLYSWPAIGGGFKGTKNYVTDMDSAEQAAPYLDAFVDLVLRTPGVERVHVIAHSMGNQLLAQWFTEVGLRVATRNAKTIDQLILAAPDIDVKTFRKVSDHMQKYANGVTLFACATDLALIASKSIRNDYPRAGDVPADTGPAVALGVDTIDISAVGKNFLSLQKYLGDSSFLDHSLFAEDREVLTDLGNLMRQGVRPPDARTVTYSKLATRDGAPYWQLPR